MSDDLDAYSAADRRRINRTARRNAGREVALILSAGFAAIMVTTFFFARYTFLPIAAMLGMRETIVWIVLSGSIAVLWALVHRAIAAPRIARARALDSAFLYAYQDARKRERADKTAI
ncbi:hypothetical protein KDD17_16720 [Sulfitobacter albidus]|uniref:Uncharacterized protein n=1 Tax=Sulfitobacter albidus TaxID=2829501 RepID=A0A975JDI0_9RHOB|nr:hypothetical protein [Sulfitobacter albidus]QUJ76492.1 hypothetical protein KDD17_16720 [Sulfitobacter albidus]